MVGRSPEAQAEGKAGGITGTLWEFAIDMAARIPEWMKSK